MRVSDFRMRRTYPTDPAGSASQFGIQPKQLIGGSGCLGFFDLFWAAARYDPRLTFYPRSDGYGYTLNSQGASVGHVSYQET